MTNFNVKTPIFIFCTPKNELIIKQKLENMKLNIEYILINMMENTECYNEFLLSTDLWCFLRRRGYKYCLVYQSDSFVVKDISSFIKNIQDNLYDYIGAPHIYDDNTYVLNGGLSLRNINAMIQTLQNNESNIILKPFIQGEDEFFSEYCKIAPIDIAKKFSFETKYFDFISEDVHGFHCFWRNNDEKTCTDIVNFLNKKYNNDDDYYNALNDIYKKLLKRSIDDSGLKIYSKLLKTSKTIEEIESIIKESKEYKLIQSSFKTDYVKPMFSKIISDIKFDVVVCRFDEDISFLKNFEIYPCHVYLYNKGREIISDHNINNITITNIKNFGYEDYAYLYHIINNYKSLIRPTLFMQCSLDHSKNIFTYIDNFEKFDNFETLSETSGVMPTNKKIKSKYGNMFSTNDLDYTYFQKTIGWNFTSVPIFFNRRYGVNMFNVETFSPGAYVYISHIYMKQYTVVQYQKVINDIIYIHKKNKRCGKIFAEMLERYFWSSVWTTI